MTLIKRYAEGFLEYAKDTIGTDRALDELRKTRDILRGNPEFGQFLENPAINYTEKTDTIEKVLAEPFSQEIRQFLKLLLKKGRIGRFSDIAEYARIKYSHEERVKVLLNTSYPLDASLIGSLKSSLEKKTAAKAQFYIDLSPEILGGVRMMYDNKIIDGSVKKRLEDLKRKLMAVKVA